MRGYQIGRVWGIPIRIHISLLVFLPILAYLIGSTGQIELYVDIIESLRGTAFPREDLAAESTRWLVGAAAAVGLFASVLLHELGHALVALRYDLEVESITLWILGGLASLSAIPREWQKELWIALAGPAVSVAVGVACYAALLAMPAGMPLLTFVVGWLAVTNLLLTVFNLLPAFPMDGGRVLRALLARNRPYVSATRIAGRIGVVFALGFAVVGVLPPISPMFLLLALFVYGAAKGETRAVVLGDLLEGQTVGDLVEDGDAIAADATVAALVDRLFAEGRSALAVTEDGAVVGAVTAADVRSLSAGERSSTTVGSVTKRELQRLPAETSAFDGLVAIDSGSGGVVLVDGPDGTHVLTRSALEEAIALGSSLGKREAF